MNQRPDPKELIGATYAGALEETKSVLEEFENEMTEILDALDDPMLSVEEASKLQARVMVLYDAIGEVRQHLAHYISFRVVHAACYGGDPSGEILTSALKADKTGAN